MAVLCAALLACAPWHCALAREPAPAKPGSAAAAPILRIGIVPLKDEAEDPALTSSLGRMLQARLGARFKGVTFTLVDPASLGSQLGDGPLLLKEAVALGQSAQVDALIDGVFGGVKIAGGSWPSLTASAPEAKGRLRWRLVECSEGLLLADGRIEPEQYKVYSQRIRTEKELRKRVLQDLVLEVGDELEKLGRLPRRAGQPAAATAEAAEPDAEPISLTGSGASAEADPSDSDKDEDAEAEDGEEGGTDTEETGR
ncbi:hypothetical protein IT575_12440 [bacterium]|nr:hypothetical protein [bacterium]